MLIVVRVKLPSYVFLGALPVAEGSGNNNVAFCRKIAVNGALGKSCGLCDLLDLCICDAVFNKAYKCFFRNGSDILRFQFIQGHTYLSSV